MKKATGNRHKATGTEAVGKRQQAAGVRICVYQPPSLGGNPIPPGEFASCIRSGLEQMPVRALIQMIEREAAVMQALGQTTQKQMDGSSQLFVSRAAALSELLVKLEKIKQTEVYDDPMERV